MDIVAKKMLTSKICKGRPLALVLMIFITTFIISIFLQGIPTIILMYGVYDSVKEIAGYDDKDDFNKFALLGIYLGAMGAFVLPFAGIQVMSIAMIDKVMAGSGVHFQQGAWVIVLALTYFIFLIVYALLLKPVFHVNMKPLASVDMSKVEKLQKTPDHFNGRMKCYMITFLIAVIYSVCVSVWPVKRSNSVVWKMFGSWGTTWIWLVATTVLMLFHVQGKQYLPLMKVLQEKTMWSMIGLIGAFSLIGGAFVDKKLGLGDWIAAMIQPMLSAGGLWGLTIIVVLIMTIATQFLNGLVLVLAMMPVVMPLVCTMSQKMGFNPSVLATVMNNCSGVAYLTYAGSVNAALLLGRKDMTQKWIWSKGSIVLVIFMILQIPISMALSYMM
jgi:di/tricarboxylate transporter